MLLLELYYAAIVLAALTGLAIAAGVTLILLTQYRRTSASSKASGRRDSWTAQTS